MKHVRINNTRQQCETMRIAVKLPLFLNIELIIRV